jgi:hypothetical protein
MKTALITFALAAFIAAPAFAQGSPGRNDPDCATAYNSEAPFQERLAAGPKCWEKRLVWQCENKPKNGCHELIEQLRKENFLHTWWLKEMILLSTGVLM